MAARSIEIERKWLVEDPPGLHNRKGIKITQGYLAVAPEEAEVRLRRKGKRYFQTVKRGVGLSRDEIEIELSAKQFKSLWPGTLGRRLEKVRYTLKSQGTTIELDVYQGKLKGLKVAEVEFKSRQQAKRFAPPSWFGREVTEDPDYKNVNLAG